LDYVSTKESIEEVEEARWHLKLFKRRLETPFRKRK
jgi:hypothetical protein